MLLHELPENSSFKTAADRDGDWTQQEYATFGLYNVADRLLSAYYAVHKDPEDETPYEPFTFLSPDQICEMVRGELAEAREEQEDEAAFYGDMGWT